MTNYPITSADVIFTNFQNFIQHYLKKKFVTNFPFSTDLLNPPPPPPGKSLSNSLALLLASQIGLQLDLYLWFCIAIMCLAELAVHILSIYSQLATSNFHHARLIATYVAKASCVPSKYSINSLSYYYYSSQLAFDFKEQQTFCKPRHINCMPSSKFFKYFFLPRYCTQLAIIGRVGLMGYSIFYSQRYSGAGVWTTKFLKTNTSRRELLSDS